MSNENRSQNLIQIVQTVKPQFEVLAKSMTDMVYEREAGFALQALQENSYLQSVAMGNQDSLKRAIINIAAIGLSLNPATKFAYLVPRDGKVCLDISYQGLIKIAADVGSIRWAVAEIVMKNDKYIFNGVGREPTHEFYPFSGDRGEIVGCYVLAKTAGGEFILTQMPIEEIFGIRDRSAGWKAHKSKGVHSIWVSDEGEMIKKTVIKRAAKAWPKAYLGHRLDEAINLSNANDPIEIEARPARTDREAILKTLDNLLMDYGMEKSRFVEHLCRVNRREIKELNDLTDIEMDQAVTQLEQWVDEKTKRGL